MNLQKLQETKQHLLLEKEKQLANLYEITGALKLLDQQIFELQAEHESSQPSDTTASNQELKTMSSKSKA
ncbi:hypothetical protein [Hyphomonas sp.]|uniref:hypothetical protein n=1 Tax=Hyphomonas sp. TaxID=87 RepID=UPI0025B89E52|nr:hypothetical protein [Hyphomonas sp.]|tara:strand:+ start:462 stop:671 length:210 start_codon:yes stop_codon:yes gene_type:complete